MTRRARGLDGQVWASFADLLGGVLGAVVLLLLVALAAQSRLAQAQRDAVGELERLRRERAELEARLARDLDGLVASGLVDLRDGVVAIQGNLLFGSGSAELTAEGSELLARAVPALVDWSEGALLLTAGHTDDVPIRTSRFGSNWELSAARATAVTRSLVQAGFPAERLVAAGFGEHHPVAPNVDEAGRASNRRVELSRVPLPGGLP